MYELPFAVDELRHKIVVRIAPLVSWGSVAYFEVEYILTGFVDEMVAVPVAGLEPGAHSRRQNGATLIGVKDRSPAQDIHELVLL